jgi:hypothetical protein
MWGKKDCEKCPRRSPSTNSAGSVKKLFAGQTNFTDQGIFFAHITFFAPPGTAVEVLPNINQLTENK